VTMLRSRETVRSAEAQKSQNRQHSDKNKLCHEGPLSSPLPARTASKPFFRDMPRLDGL
jgi:hypothetical protein